MPQDDAGNTFIIRTQAGDLASIHDMHIVPGCQAGSHMLFQKGSALEQRFERAWNGCHPHTKMIPTNVRWAQGDGSVLGECGKKVGEVVGQESCSTGQ